MSSAQITPFIMALLTASLAAQGKDLPERSVFTCPMHPKIKMAANGLCQICGMDLVAVPTPTRVRIPPDGLRAYCEDYVTKSLQQKANGLQQKWNSASPLEFVAAHAALKGDDWRKKLHDILEDGDHAWQAAAAFQLGELRDRESIPLLKRILANSSFSSSKAFCCSAHPAVTADAFGKCQECGAELIVTPGIINHIQLAGALHEMGVAAGIQALEDDSERLGGPYAFFFMALRDSPRVRKSLSTAARSESKFRRSRAVLAQLQLGMDEGFQETARLLASDDPKLRIRTIATLGESGMKRAIEPLLKIVRDHALPRRERITSAAALVRLGEQKHQGFLMDAFYKATDWDDRYLVLFALGEVGDERVLPMLKAAIEEGEFRGIAVAAAAKILGRVSGESQKKLHGLGLSTLL